MKATHRLSLGVEVSDPVSWSRAWDALSKAMVGIFDPPRIENCSVHSIDLTLDDEDEEIHTSETMAKVGAALRESGLEESEITDAINKMQNFGILFREREK